MCINIDLFQYYNFHENIIQKLETMYIHIDFFSIFIYLYTSLTKHFTAVYALVTLSIEKTK